MTLHRRLWLVLAGLFLVPVVVGALVLLLVVPDARTARVDDDVAAASRSVADALGRECVAVTLAARSAVAESAGKPPQQVTDTLVRNRLVDYAAVLAGGRVLADAGALPAGAAPTDLPGCAQGATTSSAPLVAARQDAAATGSSASSAPARSGVAAARLSAVVPGAVAGSAPGSEAVLLAGGQVVFSTLDAGSTADLVAGTRGRAGQVSLDGWIARVRPASGNVPWTTLVAVPDPGGSRTWLFLVILVCGALAAGALVTVVARNLSRPYAEIAEAAERVAGGDLDTSITPAPDGEAARLGSAFQLMTDELRRSMAEVERSRDDLRDSLERIGDTLTSTHDLDGLLQVVLETAVVTLQAQAGVVLHLSADRLQLVAEHGLHENGLPAPAGISPGRGVLGRVLSSGDSVRGRLGSGPAQLAPVENEPGTGDLLAVPLRSMGNVVGVVALYNRVDGRAFDSADEDALRTLAGQASIAVDNIHLHNEAQRLSTTDPLTGLWNFRYLSMSLAREIERSTRFDRPLAVLMLDLDHFKQVNDVYGHARGDMVLRELSHRVQEQVREVDTFARYGGEEFVIVLPETTVLGAAQLAERICNAVRREPFQNDGEEPLAVTVSIGGAAFPDQGATPATLMRSADKALYVAKADGRDRWHVPGADGAEVPGR